jgi:hypothetical protein
MIPAVQKKIDALKGFKRDLNETILLIVKDNEELIIDMNFNDQLFEQGILTNDVKIDSYAPYAPFTISIKQMKGQPTDRVTLHDEGDFEQGGMIKYGDDYFEITSSDGKTQKLIQEYGDQILGLTQSNLKSLIWDYMYPGIKKEFENAISI